MFYLLQGSFQLGVVLDNQMHLSDSLTLSEEETTYRYQAELETTLYRQGYIKVNIPIRQGTKVSKVKLSQVTSS